MAINLLPLEYELRVRQEHRRRALLGFGTMIAALIAVNGILLIPAWVAFTSQVQELNRERAAVEGGSLFAKATEIEMSIHNFNARIRSYSTLERDTEHATDALHAVLESRPAGVFVTSLQFIPASKASDQKARIAVSGKADDRAPFLAFSSALTKQSVVESVESPVANLLREARIDYSLTVVLHSYGK